MPAGTSRAAGRRRATSGTSRTSSPSTCARSPTRSKRACGGCAARRVVLVGAEEIRSEFEDAALEGGQGLRRRLGVGRGARRRAAAARGRAAGARRMVGEARGRAARPLARGGGDERPRERRLGADARGGLRRTCRFAPRPGGRRPAGVPVPEVRPRTDDGRRLPARRHDARAARERRSTSRCTRRSRTAARCRCCATARTSSRSAASARCCASSGTKPRRRRRPGAPAPQQDGRRGRRP